MVKKKSFKRSLSITLSLLLLFGLGLTVLWTERADAEDRYGKVVETFYPGQHTWAVPPGVTEVFVEAWGGGGAGGGVDATRSSLFIQVGGGGGGGAYASSTLLVEPGETLTIKVADETPAHTNGIDGEHSFVGPDTNPENAFVLAAGGSGGQNITHVGDTFAAGGAGGSKAESIGDIVIAGEAGDDGNSIDHNNFEVYSGAGGDAGGDGGAGGAGIGGVRPLTNPGEAPGGGGSGGFFGPRQHRSERGDQGARGEVEFTYARPEGYIINLMVTDENEEPIDGANVDVGDIRRITNSYGEALFVGLAPGTYDYTVNKAGYESAEAQITIVDDDVNLMIAMKESTFDITFTVFEANEHLLQGAEVYLGGRNTQVTEEAGIVTFPSVAPGNYYYSVSKACYETIEDWVNIVDNDINLQITLEVEEEPNAIIYVLSNAAGANDGDSWENAFTYLQYAWE